MRELKTSDNVIFKIETDEQFELIKKHCSDNNLTLTEDGIEIDLKGTKKEKIKE